MVTPSFYAESAAALEKCGLKFGNPYKLGSMGKCFFIALGISLLSFSHAASAFLQGFTYSPQTYNNCGPQSISAVLGYYGIKVDQATIAKAVKSTPDSYMTATVIDGYVKPYGLMAQRFKNGNINHLRNLVANGIPVVVLQWLDRPGNIPHFRVVRGFDDKKGIFYVLDPYYAENAYLSYADFELLWTVYGQEFIPIYPPSEHKNVLKLVGLK